MEEQNNLSSEPLKLPTNHTINPQKSKGLDNFEKKKKRTDEQSRVSSCTTTSSGCTFENVSAGKSLTSVPLSENVSQFDELSEVPVEYPFQPIEEIKDQARAIPLKSITAQSEQALLLSPTSVTQSISNPTVSLQTVKNGQNSSDSRTLSLVPAVKTPSDGYNWRKYGQKQVKKPEGCRSYYRCTSSECCAKKVEYFDPSSRLTETVYRSHHNHDPPQKLNTSREKKHVLTVVPFDEGSDKTSVKDCSERAPSTSPKEPIARIEQASEITKLQQSSCSDETLDDVKEQSIIAPELKKRKKRSESGTVCKAGNKPKFVVHAPGDASASSDGFRWRKYGQKMVKGNPHPRNYYRCTSAGCPVRKQIERDVDNSSTVLITYKGGHDHDMPVPKKRHAPKTTLISTIASVSDVQVSKSKTNESQIQCPLRKEGESTSETLKAQTLLGELE